MSDIIDLKQPGELPADYLLFKHSTRCPISAAAADAVRSLETSLPIYWVNVIEQRTISNGLASQLGVEHQSPQLILVRSSKAVNVWNHRSINLAISTNTVGV
jgi:bacillithiol system protein YtxJ